MNLCRGESLLVDWFHSVNSARYPIKEATRFEITIPSTPARMIRHGMHRGKWRVLCEPFAHRTTHFSFGTETQARTTAVLVSLDETLFWSNGRPALYYLKWVYGDSSRGDERPLGTHHSEQWFSRSVAWKSPIRQSPSTPHPSSKHFMASPSCTLLSWC